MRVSVRLFAGLRERAGRSQVELEDVARVEDVWSRLDLGTEPPGLLEISLCVAAHWTFLRRRAFLDFFRRADAEEQISESKTGRILHAFFLRAGVAHIHLLHFALQNLVQKHSRLGDELTERHGLCAVAIHHRLGRVEIGEASVVIAVSAPHRSAALDACREAIETLKTTIPLWKKELYTGGEEWIGRGS